MSRPTNIAQKTASLAFVTLVVTGCHGIGAVYVKDKIAYTRYDADLKQCYENARTGVSYNTQPIAGAGNTSVAASAATGFAGGIVSGYMRAKRESEAAQACMKAQGYNRVVLNARDREFYNATESAETRTEILQRINGQIKTNIYPANKEP